MSSSSELLTLLAARLWDLAAQTTAELVPDVQALPPDPAATEPPLAGRLLAPVTALGQRSPLAALVLSVIGEPGTGGRVAIHGWRHTPGGEPGIALVVAEGPARAVLGVTPGSPPTLDVVVTPGARITATTVQRQWTLELDVSADAAWDATFVPGGAEQRPGGTVTVTVKRTEPIELAARGVPVLKAKDLALTFRATPQTPAALDADLGQIEVAVLRETVARLLGTGDRRVEPVDVKLLADRAGGLRFGSGGLRVPLPGRLSVPGLSARDFALELSASGDQVHLTGTLALSARLPGMPVTATLSGVGTRIPFALSHEALGPLLDQVGEELPSGIAIALSPPVVKGGGMVSRLRPGTYAGALDMDLGAFAVQAFASSSSPPGMRARRCSRCSPRGSRRPASSSGSGSPSTASAASSASTGARTWRSCAGW